MRETFAATLLSSRFLSTSGDISAAPCGAARDLVLIRGGDAP
jgi:hypothetical protein